jgi:hypothetical protein
MYACKKSLAHNELSYLGLLKISLKYVYILIIICKK